MEGVTISLTSEKSEELFFTALCGIDVMANYGISFHTDPLEYKAAKASLDNGACREDIWMKILQDGGTLTIIDYESADNDDEREKYPITMKEVHERVQKTDISHLMDALNENGDGTTDDVIIQTVFFNEVMFG